jgi:xylulokinase
MRDNFLLGIDLGTTVCKAGIWSQKGELVTYTHIEYELVKEGGGIVEQDASQWWKVTVQAIRQSIKKAGIDKNCIKALSISSQGISFVPVDKQINPLCTSINWLDTRAEKEVELILDKISFSRMFAITGKRTHPSYTLPKILWLTRERPEVVDKTYKFLMPHDFLVAKLTGKCFTDHTMAAGTLMYDVNSLNWSREIMNQFDIPIEKLSFIKWAATPVGTISNQAARETDLSSKTLVVVGGQDQKCAALGAGLTEGIATLSLGTAVALTTIGNKPIVDQQMRIPCSPYLLKNHWVLEGFVGTGGESFRWLKQILGDTNYSYEKFIDIAKEASLGAKGVLFFPHLSGATSPHWRSKAKGVFYGLSLSASTKDLVRSLLEGIAFQIKENLEVLEELTGEVKEIRVFGGGARSKFWGEMIANVAGKRVYLLSLKEAAIIGASFLAGMGSGVYKNYQEATKSLENLSYIKLEPDICVQRRYEELYSNYRKVEEKILGCFNIKGKTGKGIIRDL